MLRLGCEEELLYTRRESNRNYQPIITTLTIFLVGCSSAQPRSTWNGPLVHWIVVFWTRCWKHCQRSHWMHVELDDNNTDGSPCFSGHRTPTETYSAWEEWLTAACMPRHQVLKSGNADLLPFPGLEDRVLWLVTGNCVALRSAHFFGEELVMFCR